MSCFQIDRLESRRLLSAPKCISITADNRGEVLITFDQPLLVSSAFAASVGEARSRLVSVGRYALRGVGHPQDLFTLEELRSNDDA